MNNNAPLVVVTCLRDIKMLELQAQSFHHHYIGDADVFIVVNEFDSAPWLAEFDKFRHYYNRFNLTVLFRSDFDIDCDNKHGWDDQQLLKLAISLHVKQDYYFILDTQNFLVRPWTTAQIPMIDGKVPYRSGHFALPMTTWHEYNLKLGISLPDPTPETMSFCTPIFFKTEIVRSLINSHETLNKFGWWFRTASRIKSEFILYYQWAEKNGGFLSHHYLTECWANPYLRDSSTFSKDVETFFSQFRITNPCWVSINHRSWGDLSEDEYVAMKNLLSQHNLTLRFDEYRIAYNAEKQLKVA
jgi:hypothetical protein